MSMQIDSTAGRSITYAEALQEAVESEMGRDPSVIVFGLGVDDPVKIYGTTAGLQERFGEDRVFDTPLAEDSMTGVAIGAAFAGLRPIHVHIRMDFLMLAMNQLVNIAAKASYMYGGQLSVPIVIRAVIGRSWGQGPQHSQALHSLFMHVPGLHVVAPATPYDAKGTMISAIRDNNPVLMMEHRLLYSNAGVVPEEPYEVPFGKARRLLDGTDVTLIGVSHMSVECVRAAGFLRDAGIYAEVIDLLSLSPLDIDTILNSVSKTGRLLVVDNAWLQCGASAEVIARVAESLPRGSDVHMQRMGFAPVPAPTTRILEDEFYPNAQTISLKAYEMVRGASDGWVPPDGEAGEVTAFRGPF